MKHAAPLTHPVLLDLEARAARTFGHKDAAHQLTAEAEKYRERIIERTGYWPILISRVDGPMHRA